MKFIKILELVINQKIIIILFFFLITIPFFTDYFFTYNNLINLLTQISVNGIIAIGMTYLLITREFDLSVGSNMALVGVVTIIFLNAGYGVAVGIVAGILTGTLVGAFNGFLITRLKVNSLATTLGGMIAFRGLVAYLTNSETVKGTNQDFLNLGSLRIVNIPYNVIIYIILLLIFGIILSRSIFGRNIYAIGGNEQASNLFGINSSKK